MGVMNWRLHRGGGEDHWAEAVTGPRLTGYLALIRVAGCWHCLDTTCFMHKEIFLRSHGVQS